MREEVGNDEGNDENRGPGRGEDGEAAESGGYALVIHGPVMMLSGAPFVRWGGNVIADNFPGLGEGGDGVGNDGRLAGDAVGFQVNPDGGADDGAAGS